MVSIFDYTDFQKYLQAYYAEQRKLHCYFTYQWLTEKAGFSNRGFLYNIINKKGTRLSTSHCLKLSEALGHSKKEAEYFTYIVAHVQETEPVERAELLKKAVNIAAIAKTDLIRKDQNEYYAKWYHSVIRSLIGMSVFKGDYVQLSRKLIPAITPDEARESIELLERLCIIKRDENGIYHLGTEKNIKIGSDFSQTEKNKFHLEYMKISRDSMLHHFPEQQVLSWTIGISEETADVIRQEVLEFKERIKKLIDADTGTDRVYLYQSLLIPLTKKNNG